MPAKRASTNSANTFTSANAPACVSAPAISQRTNAGSASRPRADGPSPASGEASCVAGAAGSRRLRASPSTAHPVQTATASSSGRTDQTSCSTPPSTGPASAPAATADSCQPSARPRPAGSLTRAMNAVTITPTVLAPCSRRPAMNIARPRDSAIIAMLATNSDSASSSARR